MSRIHPGMGDVIVEPFPVVVDEVNGKKRIDTNVVVPPEVIDQFKTIAGAQN